MYEVCRDTLAVDATMVPLRCHGIVQLELQHHCLCCLATCTFDMLSVSVKQKQDL